ISPNFIWVNGSGDGIAEDHVIGSNRMPANDAAICFLHFGKATANNTLQNFGIAFLRKTDERKGRNRISSHCVNIAECICRGDGSEEFWLVDNRGEEIYSLH